MKNIKKNKGSAVIEISMLIPIFFLCIYGYIMIFLCFIDAGRKWNQMSLCLYSKERIEKNFEQKTTKNMRTIKGNSKYSFFFIDLELRKGEVDPVENIRRWQWIGETF